MIPFHFDPIELNNMGVQSLEHGNYDYASDLLTLAVRLIVKTSNIDENHSQQHRLQSKYNTFRWSINAPQEKKESDLSIGTFTFSRGMFINVRKRHTVCNLSSDMKAVIAYNTGLSFHLLATENNDSTLLVKAGKMYRLSQSILRESIKKGSPMSKLCLNYFFHVVLLNNLGQLSYELVDYEASGYYFEHLEMNLKHLVLKGMPYDGGAFDRRDFLGMISNTIVNLPNAAPCA